MAKDGRETYLSTYLDQASQGMKTLSERDRTAMKIFHKRIRENGVYFLVDNLAATTSTEAIENLNVYQEGFLRPPYETITLAIDALNTGGTTTPTLVFIDCFSGGEGAFFYYSTRYNNDRWSVPNVFWYMPFDGSMFRPTPTELRSEGKWQVDFRPKYMLKDHVDELLAKDGMTMIVVTHEMGFAREVADELVFMDGGVIVESGQPRELLSNPQHERTQAFLSKVM